MPSTGDPPSPRLATPGGHGERCVSVSRRGAPTISPDADSPRAWTSGGQPPGLGDITAIVDKPQSKVLPEQPAGPGTAGSGGGGLVGDWKQMPTPSGGALPRGQRGPASRSSLAFCPRQVDSLGGRAVKHAAPMWPEEQLPSRLSFCGAPGVSLSSRFPVPPK